MYLPAVGRSRQPMIFISVDFPDPEGPMIATYSPCVTIRSMPERAWISCGPSWYTRVSPCISIRVELFGPGIALRLFLGYLNGVAVAKFFEDTEWTGDHLIAGLDSGDDCDVRRVADSGLHFGHLRFPALDYKDVFFLRQVFVFLLLAAFFLRQRRGDAFHHALDRHGGRVRRGAGDDG